MTLFNDTLFLVTVLSILVTDVASTYTHAAFINDVRRTQNRYGRSRSLSTYDPSEEYSLQMNNTALFGLQPCTHRQCKRIAVVGAGVAGLIIAYELTRAGHEVIVYEASERAGGRFFTYDTGKTIIELGGMRLPLDVHTLTDAYVRKRFYLPLEPFVSFHPNTFVYINGIKHRSDNTSYLPQEYNLPVYLNEQNKSPFAYWNEAMKPLFDLFSNEGWNSVMDKYGSYSIKQYLSEFGLSDIMIDYIGLLFGISANLFTALTSYFRDLILLNEHTPFYHIIGGNKLLIDKLSEPCQINYSTSVLSIHRNEDRTVNITVKTLMNITRIINFDRVVVATTAPAARFIRYTPINEQIKKMSRALRQIHYECSSKIVLYFSYPWWHDENIHGGLTVTDLPLRFIYYDNYNTTINTNNHTEYVLLASYTSSQDSTLWLSSTIDQITNRALNNLEEIHSTSNLRNYYLRTIVKHWCADSFSHGAYASFLPYQEKDIKPILMESFDNLVYFAGEHLSTAHAWCEGAVLSGLRVLTQLQEENFDIVIVGGGLLALQTAIELANRQPIWNILLLEEYTFLNSTCLNQFEPSSTNRTTREYLLFGPNLTNIQFNSTDLMEKYYFENLSNNYRGQLNGKLEYINTTKMIIDMLNIVKQERYINITIRDKEYFINNIQNQIITNRGTIIVNHKVLFLDNCYINDHIQRSINPLKLNIKIEQFPLLSFPSIRTNFLPTWLYNNEILGFDINDTKSERRIILFNSNISLGLSWLREHASSLIDINLIKSQSNYKRTTLIDHGHIIDYLPNSNKQSILFIGQTNIDLYPIWVKILTDLTLNIYSPNMINYSISLPNRLLGNSSFRISLSMNIFLFSLFFFLFK